MLLHSVETSLLFELRITTMATDSHFARSFFQLVLVAAIFDILPLVKSITDSSDVQALQVMYTSLNSPSQLTGWTSGGGDPCGESWKGITCEGSAVVSIDISGLGLDGTMGYMLANLVSLKNFDVSDNKIHDSVPYQLPPNLTSLNLAKNNLSGNLPYSISIMPSLNYLNVSHNSLSQSIGDVFSNGSALATLDLSFNNFSSDLPNAMGSLSNLSSLYVQNNQLTGSLNVLTSLPLTTLNVANNHFTGWIPGELLSIPSFIYGGNTFDNGPAPPPPPFTPPPPGKSHGNRNHTGSGTHKSDSNGEGEASHSNGGLAIGALVGIILGSVSLALIALLVLVVCIRKHKRKDTGARTSGASLSVRTNSVNTDMQEQRVKPMAAVTDLKPPPAEKVMVDRLHGKNGTAKRAKSPITATSYTVASLQTATNSFSQEFLIGEGSLGRVYRADFPNGKIMAVKKIDNAALSLQEEDNFLEAISNMSRLRHPNIVTLAGYCAEHGQRLLVYEYVGNGSLHDMLHFSEDGSKILTWNARVRVALGTARALEYLHEVCLPSVVHRNFKSANILLDEELNPHLSDCGVAALTPNPERQVSTFSRVRSEQSLVRWATPQLHDIDALAKMVDPALNGMYAAKSLSRFADIIALCVQPEPEFRPPMSEVVQALVRLVQRASVVKRRSNDESGFSYRTPDHEAIDMSKGGDSTLPHQDREEELSEPNTSLSSFINSRLNSSTPRSRQSSPANSPRPGPSRFSFADRSCDSKYDSSFHGFNIFGCLLDQKKQKPRQQRARRKVGKVWYGMKRVKGIVILIFLLGLFLLVDWIMLSRLQNHGIHPKARSSTNSASVSARKGWKKFGKGKSAHKGIYGRMLALAAHALAEGQNKPEPKDLWLEPFIPASSWKPCADQRNWEPNEGKNGYILVTANGGMNQQRVAVCNAVVLARLLNATLVVPKFLYSSVWKDVSQFRDIYQEEHFINYLSQDIRIVKELPKELGSLDLKSIGSIITDEDIRKEAKPSFYLKNVLPILLKNGVVHFLGFGNRLAFDPIPFQLQRLRCRCNFHALQFAPKIQETGALILQRLRHHESHPGGPLDHYLVGSYAEAFKRQNQSHPKKASRYLALHLRFEIDMVAHSLCEFGGGEEERKELEAYREIHFPALTLLKKTTKLPSPQELRSEGLCPLTPEESILMLAALGFNRKTRIFVAGSQIYGGRSRLIALTNLYPKLVTKENLLSPTELEPFANFSSQLAALDYIGCAAADAFAMTDSGSQLSSLVSGFRIYYGGGKMATIRPNKRRLASIFTKNSTIEWRIFEQRVRKAVRQTKHVQTRPKGRSVYRYPRCKECMCRTE
ncbi:hypothetical protein G4B88_010639 [Cannabis sativa]|uniref:O-fucosyltransferase family protein n=1 Tax=Cannabis sativa TaxID=3483 RepID=A0A7J6G8F2_CANSA|nr:hypothetical protein G4B88_010639 [Cannabis sativa]